MSTLFVPCRSQGWLRRFVVFDELVTNDFLSLDGRKSTCIDTIKRLAAEHGCPCWTSMDSDGFTHVNVRVEPEVVYSYILDGDVVQ